MGGSCAAGEQTRGREASERGIQKPKPGLKLLQAPDHPCPAAGQAVEESPWGVGGHNSLKCEALGAPVLDLTGH